MILARRADRCYNLGTGLLVKRSNTLPSQGNIRGFEPRAGHHWNDTYKGAIEMLEFIIICLLIFALYRLYLFIRRKINDNRIAKRENELKNENAKKVQ